MRKLAKGRSKRAPQTCSYLFEISALQATYSFHESSGFQPVAFEEHLHPHIDARCLFPPKLAGRDTRFVILGDRQLEKSLRTQQAATTKTYGIGTLTMRGQQSSYLGSIPYDAAWRIGLMVASEAFRFIYLHGEALFRGSARIRSMHFYQTFDLDEL